MPAPVDDRVKGQVIQDWSAGKSSDEIATKKGIGAGSVSNIINEFKCGLENYDYISIRELAVQIKKEGITFPQLALMYRRHNYIKKLGANEEQIESLIANLLDGARSLPEEKIVDLMNQVYEISKSESIPLTEVPQYVNQSLEKKKRLEDEIQKARSSWRRRMSKSTRLKNSRD